MYICLGCGANTLFIGNGVVKFYICRLPLCQVVKLASWVVDHPTTVGFKSEGPPAVVAGGVSGGRYLEGICMVHITVVG